MSTESTVARMAGNIASGMMHDIELSQVLKREPDDKDWQPTMQAMAKHAVALARAILAETRRTAPEGP